MAVPGTPGRPPRARPGSRSLRHRIGPAPDAGAAGAGAAGAGAADAGAAGAGAHDAGAPPDGAAGAPDGGGGPAHAGAAGGGGAAPSSPRPGVGTPRETVVVDLDWRSVVVVLAAFVGLIAATGLFRSVPRLSADLAAGLLLALALNPLVALLGRRLRLPRGACVGSVLAGFAAVVTLIAFLLVPPAVEQARDLGRELPQVTEDLADLPIVGDDLQEADVPARLQQLIAGLPERLAGDTTPLERAGRSIADGAVAASVTLLLAVAALLDGDRLLRGLRRLVPRQHRARADHLAQLAYSVIGKYVAGSLLVAAIAGTCTLVAGLVLGVPLTPLLAVWVATFDLVPQIGGAVGGIPFVLLGMTQGLTVGLACALFFVIYLQIENNVLGPLLVGQAVELSPPATMTAALVGVSAGGVVGALLAVPLTGAAKVLYLELRGMGVDPGGYPATGDPATGDPANGDPANGDPANGDPGGGDSSSGR